MRQMIKRGINVSGFGDWSVKNPLFNEKHFRIIHDAGFDHVRLPFYFGNRNGINLSEDYFALVEELTGFARKYGMVAVVDMHGFCNMDDEPEKYRDAFIASWEKIAERLKNEDENVWFEIINEPHNAFDPILLNDYQNAAIGAIRKTNPDRMLIAAAAHYNTIDNLDSLILPEKDPNIIVAIHNYTPMAVTHQGAEWCDGKYPAGVSWEGNPEEIGRLEKMFVHAYEWSQKSGRKLWLGEFGVYDKGDMLSRVRWTENMVKLCDKYGIAWAYWEFACGFGAYDLNKRCWKKDLMHALIPELTF